MTESASYEIISFKGSELPRQYEPMLFSRWLRSMRYGNAIYKKISVRQYYENYHKLIEALLKKPDCLVRLAVLSEDHDVVLGFSVSREDVLDYVHVHTAYRNAGIGRKLIPSGITTFTYVTALGIIIWQSKEKYKGWKFNPFA